MSVTVRFPLLLISIPVRFALHLSLWSNFRSCLHVFVLLLSACSGSWLSAQVVLVAAVLLLRSLLLLLRLLFVAAPTAALVLLQRPWLLQWVLFLAISAGASFGCLCGALFCYSFGRSCRLRQLGHFLACYRGCSYDGCFLGCWFHVTAFAAAVTFLYC